METILVVDDDPGFRRLLATILSGEGYTVESAASVTEARRVGTSRKFDLVLTDLRLPDGDGLAVLKLSKEFSPDTPVIMITAFATVPTAVEAMKLGAADYIGKPLSSPNELRVLVRRTLDQGKTAAERKPLEQPPSPPGFIADDPGMRRVVQMASKVARTNSTVLIMGESGTGKELIARFIHDNSARADRVFVAVNCAALAPSLVESELFGHERGAFTGAVAQHVGRFERAHGGTLFLGEIGELDAAVQAKLLRVLQEMAFERVGGARQITVDVRMIAATNRDLKAMMADGKFREDLYYRLSAFPIEIPPLRDRVLDIRKLARLFLERAAARIGRGSLRLTPEAESVLASYAWPGNVRELQNVVERVAILCDSDVNPDDLPLATAGPVRPVLFKDIERRAIEEALASHGGNRTRAAKELGISLRTLQYRLKEYGIAGS